MITANSTPIKDALNLIAKGIKYKGFRQITGDRWFNIDFGIMPQSLVDNSFFLYVSTGDNTLHNSGVGMRVRVEFVLDSKNDNYENRIDAVIGTMYGLSKYILDNRSTDADQIFMVNQGPAPFTTVYIGDYFVMRFDFFVAINASAILSFDYGQKPSNYMDNDTHVKGHWIFDSDYHADIRKDVSGNGNDLTASSGFDYSNQLTGDNPISDTGNSLKYDGQNDSFSTGGDDFNPGSDNFTVDGWIKPGNVGKALIGNATGSSSDYVWYIDYDNSGHLRLFMKDQLIASSSEIAGIASPAWVHFAIVRNELTVKIYINGALDETESVAEIYNLSVDHDLDIGYITAGSYNDGYILELRYSDSARTADEISDYYTEATA